MLQPLRWCCVDCVIHHERDVREEQTPYIHVAGTSSNRVIMACELYCCLLPQCEALRICPSGFPTATVTRSSLWATIQHGLFKINIMPKAKSDSML